jgi:hypothetical protein
LSVKIKRSDKATLRVAIADTLISRSLSIMVSDVTSSTTATPTADTTSVDGEATTTGEVTDPAYDDYETRNGERNHVGVDDHTYLSSSQSTSTEGASTSTDRTTSKEGETTVDEHYNKLFADSKYGSVGDMKYS